LRTRRPGILCKVDWAEDFKFQASTTIPNTQLAFSISPERDGANLNLVFSGGDHDVKVDFKPAPIDELFIRHPQVLVNCTAAAGLAAGYIAYDTIANEQAKNWSPLLSGRGYKLTVKDISFKLSIPKLEVKDLHERALFTLKPNLLSQALAYEK